MIPEDSRCSRSASCCPPGDAMSKPHDLKTIGLKATLPRLKILNLFENSDVRHLTAEDVYKVLLKEGMDIGLATIYRVLTQFEQAGILIRHHFEAGKAVFELNEGGHHDHLVCIQCGHVEEFFDSEIEKRQLKVAKHRGFNIHEHSLQIYADCVKTNCPNRPKRSSSGACGGCAAQTLNAANPIRSFPTARQRPSAWCR